MFTFKYFNALALVILDLSNNKLENIVSKQTIQNSFLRSIQSLNYIREV